MIYAKPPLTYAQQIALLQKRGLIVPDVSKAEMFLSQISYYRLSAYFYPFQVTKDVFNPRTTFENILDTYSFDRELRLLILDEIERVEVSFRAQIIYQLSHKYGSHWQDDNSIFKRPYTHPATGKTVDIYADTQNIIYNQCNAKTPEVFIDHYINTYTSPLNPPSWMCIELLTIGELSRLFTALNNNKDKKDIANFFNLHHTISTSWIHTVVYVRNICAHHSRLWNREFAIKPDVLTKPLIPWISTAFNANNHRTFYFLSILKYLLSAANPTGHFKAKLINLFNKYPAVPIRYLGIPTNAKGELIDWQNEPLWF